MDKALYQKVDRWMEAHKQQLVEDVMRLVRIRSISRYNTGAGPFGQGCLDVLAEMLKIGEEHGFHTRNYENYLGSLWLDEAANKQSIGFWGHLDVVPEGEDWDFAPYNPVCKDGWLIGRGVQDNKGPTIATMYVIQCLKEIGVELKHSLRMFVGCDEEHGMQDMAYYTKNYPCPDMSIIADTDFPVCYGEKGIIEAHLKADTPVSRAIRSFTGGVASNMVPDRATMVLDKSLVPMAKLQNLGEGITVTEKDDSISILAVGTSRHAAFPKGGINAIHRLSTALAACGALPSGDVALLQFLNLVNEDFAGTGLEIAYEDEVSGALTCVGSTISCEGGILSLGINIRYPITADSAKMQQAMADVCKKHGYTFVLDRDSGPSYFPKEHPAVARLTDLYNEFTGQETTPYVMGGGTYARKLPNAFAYGMEGMPSGEKPAFIRPGHGGAHGPDEAQNIDSLLTAMKLFCMAILEIDDLDLTAGL